VAELGDKTRLASATGSQGMTGGQAVDLESEALAALEAFGDAAEPLRRMARSIAQRDR
jgi:hypothetical protein